jgi:stage V sporulation protein SpoVS
MKKRLLACFLTAAFTLALLSGCSQDSSGSAPANADRTEENELTKVTLNEVAHSIFYAPMYVAVEEGYFAEEGIDLDLVCGFGDNILGRDNGVKMIQYSPRSGCPGALLCHQKSWNLSRAYPNAPA